MPKHFISSYFGFNKQQRNGLYVLVCISFFLLLVRLLYPLFIRPDNIVIKDLPLIRMQLDSNYSQQIAANKTRFQNTNNTKNLFEFDPNTVSQEELLQLGFTKKTAAIFIKYRSKGFRFNTKGDVKKVFGVSDKLYTNLEPFILIQNPKITPGRDKLSNQENHRSEIKTQTIKLDLNTVDSIALLQVNGIGPSYAKRILKYRSLLGGFYHVSQLKEVYGFTDEIYNKVAPSFFVGEKELKKINLNKDDFKTVNKHPYLSYEQTKAIFDWRRKTVITSTNLSEILMDSASYRKLLPYMYFD